MAKRQARFGLVLDSVEQEALQQLAEAGGGLSRAATVRLLIRQAAQSRGLWPGPSNSRCAGTKQAVRGHLRETPGEKRR